MSSIVKTIDIGSVGEWGVEHGYLTTPDIRGQYSNKSVVVASLSNEGTTTPEDIMSEYFSSDPIYWSALQPSPNSLPRLQNYKTTKLKHSSSLGLMQLNQLIKKRGRGKLD